MIRHVEDDDDQALRSCFAAFFCFSAFAFAASALSASQPSPFVGAREACLADRCLSSAALSRSFLP